MERKVVYIAHPLGSGPDREANRQNAAAWCSWAVMHFNVTTVADWVVLSGVLSEDHRDLGLECDLALVERCDELWLVGGRVSPGMEIERAHAIAFGVVVRDFTALGFATPDVEQLYLPAALHALRTERTR